MRIDRTHSQIHMHTCTERAPFCAPNFSGFNSKLGRAKRTILAPSVVYLDHFLITRSSSSDIDTTCRRSRMQHYCRASVFSAYPSIQKQPNKQKTTEKKQQIPASFHQLYNAKCVFMMSVRLVSLFKFVVWRTAQNEWSGSVIDDLKLFRRRRHFLLLGCLLCSFVAQRVRNRPLRIGDTTKNVTAHAQATKVKRRAGLYGRRANGQLFTYCLCSASPPNRL